MLPGVLLVFIFFVVLYASTYENRQFRATASALREIWSGGCRLSCRRSAYSVFSGLNGHAGTERAAPHAPHCICDYCPCAAIDNVLRSCRPATTVYANILDALAEFYYSILKAISEVLLLLQHTLECRVSCQRRAQLVNANSLNPEENFNFKDDQPSDNDTGKDKVKQKETTMEKIKKQLSFISKIDLHLSKSDTKIPTTSAATAKQSKSDNKTEKEIIEKASKELKAMASKDSLDTDAVVSSTSSCPRCVEKGKICMRGCPKANATRK